MPGLLPRRLLASSLCAICFCSCSGNQVDDVNITRISASLLAGGGLAQGASQASLPNLNAVLSIQPAFTSWPQLGLPAEIATQESKTACPVGMILVEGQYCPDVEQRCIRWMESEGRYAFFRCAEYARPAKCRSTARKAMQYCIDRDEYVPRGETLPASNQSWTMAKQTCESLGKRVCKESEWVFACEGEEMRPYPYGFTRDANACNADKVDIYRTDGMLKDLREGADDHPGCVSPFGVHHLSGNLEEWTTIDAAGPPRPAMKGAYWQPSRNHCRAAQTAHDRFYHGSETGFRCCKDVEPLTN